MYVLLLMRSSSECPPPVSPLSNTKLEVLSARDLRLLTGLKLAYNDRGLVPNLRTSLRVLELRPLDLDLRRLPRRADSRCAPGTRRFKVVIIIIILICFGVCFVSSRIMYSRCVPRHNNSSCTPVLKAK